MCRWCGFWGAVITARFSGEGSRSRELEREILHAKVMLIDGERTVVGSANLDQRSFHRNFEINLIIDDATFGGQVAVMLLKDFAESRRIALDDHERRGWTSGSLRG